MINPNKPMKSIASARRKIIKDIEAMSTETELLSNVTKLKEAFENSCRQFNLMRETLAIFKQPIYDLSVKSPLLMSHVREARGIDVERYVTTAVEGSSALDAIEDGEKFLTVIEELSGMTSARDVMNKCIELNRLGKLARERWDGKRKKMEDTLRRVGDTDPNAQTMRNKITAFEEYVSAIDRRRETVSAIFFDAKKRVESFIQGAVESFTGYKEVVNKRMKLTI